MNLNRIIRLKLMLLFVLLQCMAPVAHAHVNGNNFSQHAPTVHTPRLVLHSHDHQDSDSTGISADEQHSAVVSMPPEYRCSGLKLLAQPVTVNSQSQPVQSVRAVISFAAPNIQTFPLPSYQHPFSQAPPL